MATALVSLLTGKPIKSDVGMTGEITLRGQVLPVGGIKEKMLAAHRAGLKTVILPQRNEADLEDLPDEVLKKLDFRFVKTVDQVMQFALEGIGEKKRVNGRKSGVGKKTEKQKGVKEKSSA